MYIKTKFYYFADDMNGNDDLDESLTSLLESKLHISKSEWDAFLERYGRLSSLPSLQSVDSELYQSTIVNNNRYLRCIYFDTDDPTEQEIKQNLEQSITCQDNPETSLQYTRHAYQMIFQLFHTFVSDDDDENGDTESMNLCESDNEL